MARCVREISQRRAPRETRSADLKLPSTMNPLTRDNPEHALPFEGDGTRLRREGQMRKKALAIAGALVAASYPSHPWL